jgi:cytochrome oxidase Cu insertion factor (SCO1/SenC/PrrC family)
MSEAKVRPFRPSSRVARGVAVLLATLWAQADAGAALSEESLYEQPLSFLDDTGTPVALSTFRGREVVLTMFYARCRSACPATLERLRQVDRAFTEHDRSVEVVLVSYDFDFDTPHRLARYRSLEKVPSRWHLLCGERQAVETLAQKIGLGRHLDMGDHILHSYRIVLLDESGVVRKALDADHDKIPSLFEGGSGPLAPVPLRK